MEGKVKRPPKIGWMNLLGKTCHGLDKCDLGYLHLTKRKEKPKTNSIFSTKVKRRGIEIQTRDNDVYLESR